MCVGKCTYFECAWKPILEMFCAALLGSGIFGFGSSKYMFLESYHSAEASHGWCPLKRPDGELPSVTR